VCLFPAPQKLSALALSENNYKVAGYLRPHYRADQFQAKLTLTDRNSMVSKIWKLRFSVCHEKVEFLFSFD
jgi:hypothetical protein